MGKATGTTGVSSDTGAFALIPEWVLYHPQLSAMAVRLYATLGRHADDTGQAYPSKKRLSTLVGCSISTIDRCVVELVAAGALAVTPRARDDGSRTSNLYFLRRGHPVDDVGGHPVDEAGPHLVDEGAMNETHDEREPEERDNPLPAAPVAAPYDPAKGVKVKVEGEARPQDLVWNALAQAIDTDESPHGSRMRSAVLRIRVAIWGWVADTRGEPLLRDLVAADPEGYERRAAETVALVARRIRDSHPGLTWGPEGIARHFREALRQADSSRTTQSIVEEVQRESAG